MGEGVGQPGRLNSDAWLHEANKKGPRREVSGWREHYCRERARGTKSETQVGRKTGQAG